MGSHANPKALDSSRLHMPATLTRAPGVSVYGFRYYNPKRGRWESRDPIGEQGGPNLYGFLGNDGANRIDRLGREIYAAIVPAPHETGTNFEVSSSANAYYEAQAAVRESKIEAEEWIDKLRSLSDRKFDRLTKNGQSVIWMKSSTKVGPGGVDVGGIVRDSKTHEVKISRRKLIEWLTHEENSMVEIFKGDSNDVLSRTRKRASEELSSEHPWTSFGLVAHGGGGSLQFTDNSATGGDAIRSQLKSIGATNIGVHACGMNSQGAFECPIFQRLKVEIDPKTCTLVFTPAQVVKGIVVYIEEPTAIPDVRQ